MNIIKEMVEIIGGKDAPKDLQHYLTCVSLFGCATITSSIRATVVVPTDYKKIPANVYIVAVAGSGLSKSRSLGYVETLFIDEASDNIKKQVEKAIENLDPFALEEVTKLSNEGVKLSLIFKSATDSGVSAVRSIMDKFGLYSVNIALDEIGSVILKEFDLLSDTLLNAYDHGKLKPSLRRTTGVSVTENAIPHNLLMFGSPTLLFEGSADVEKKFFDLLQAGMTRRSIFSDVTTKTNHYSLIIDDEMKGRIKKVSDRMVEVSNMFMNKSVTLSKEAATFYTEYEKQCKIDSESVSKFDLYNSVYTQNRHWLALKISGIIAMMDLSFTVELEHYMQAVEIVDSSQANMDGIVNRQDKYELLVDWLLEEGTEENEYTLTQKLPFYKDVKNKKQFLELMKGYAFQKNITLMIQEKQNLTFYSAKGRKKVDLEKPLLFSYSNDMAKDYFDNDEFVWNDLYKVITSDKGLCYSAHCYKEGHRTKDNAIEGFELLILDIDADVTLDMAKLLFEDYTYLIATTRSHQVEKNGEVCDRFRVILPMRDRLELDKDQYSKFYKAMIEDLPITVDTSVNDISRMMFSASGSHWYNEGKLFDASKYIPNTQESEVYTKEGNRLAGKNINGIGQYILRNEGNGRNNSLIKFSLLLMDSGYTHDECKAEVLRLNKQFQNPLAESEVKRTIFKTIERREEKVVEEDEYEDDYNYDEDDVFSQVNK